MSLSHNEYKLIDALNFSDFITATEIANNLKVSTKTVYRLISKINDVTNSKYKKCLIITEPGKGNKLNVSFANYHIYELLNSNNSDTEINAIIKILFKIPKSTKVEDIMPVDYMSISTVQRQINKIKTCLAEFNLIVNYKDEELNVEGSEKDVRDAIKYYFKKSNNNAILGKLNNDISKKDDEFLKQQIQIIEKELNAELSYPYDVNLYTHLFLLIKRYRDGEVNLIKNQKPIDKNEEFMIRSNRHLFDLSNEIIKNISQYISRELHELEPFFLLQYLNSFQSDYAKFSPYYEKLSDKVVKSLINEYFKQVEDDFLKSNAVKNLINDLKSHIKPMLYRLNSGIDIENILSYEIKTEYPCTYKKIKKIVKKINKKLKNENFQVLISESDIGYIVLYFEKYELTQRQKKKILLVCSTGIGTSELLRMKIEAQFTGIEVIDSISQRTLKNYITNYDGKIDGIFTTINIDIENLDIEHVPIVNISPLLTSRDIEIITNVLRGGRKLKEISLEKVIGKELIIAELDAHNKDDCIQKMVDLLYDQKVINDKTIFLNDIYKRETEGETGIGQGVAIPHGKSDAVIKTRIAIAKLKTPIEWGSLDDRKVSLIFMFAVKNNDASTIHIKMLQQVAILLADDNFIEEVMSMNKAEDIFNIIIHKKGE
ncbi:BglG family transcription antiterminator [Allofustis seminis]|uniref:BglG family transcription antiterminator n=1 Tax=Allofustis seminis TaxID=166939 RepID=UPI00036FD65F|nr:fructose PTS transporter subunit IIA [Allofustis seminis]